MSGSTSGFIGHVRCFHDDEKLISGWMEFSVTTGFCAQPRASYERQTGGRKWDHGRAASKAAAALSTVASENRWPTICRPTGSPSLEKPAGTLHAGRCARLKL